MIVPGLSRATPDLDETNSAFDQSARDEQLSAVNPVAVEVANVLRLAVQIERLGRLALHPIGQLERLNPCFEQRRVLTLLRVEFVQLLDEIQLATLLSGQQKTVDAHNQKLKSDPVTGEIGELGFGTQELPPSGRDIQDEKILGTLHVATGRSDHLGGHLTPEKFANAKNATHDDILFSPTKTPEIRVTQVRMYRDGKTTTVIENYEPSPYLRQLLN